MSTSASSPGRSDGPRQDSTEPVEDTTLTIDVAAEDTEGVDQVIEPLAGNLPKDLPVWTNHTELDEDTRGMYAFTIRYGCSERPSFIVPFEIQEEVRNGIWRRVRQILQDDDAVPTVMFDECRSTHGSTYGAIDLVFTSDDALKKVLDKIDDIEVELDDGSVTTYDLRCSTNSLNGNILVFECLRLPLDTIDPHELLEAFKDVAASVGTVLGIGKVVTEVGEWGLRRETGSLRGYIRIHPNNLTLPWRELSRRLVTHFKWQGYPYYFSFPGREHLEEDRVSADYPHKLGQAAQRKDSEVEAEAGASRRSKRARGVTDGSDTAGAGTWKQRRSKQ